MAPAQEVRWNYMHDNAYIAGMYYHYDPDKRCLKTCNRNVKHAAVDFRTTPVIASIEL